MGILPQGQLPPDQLSIYTPVKYPHTSTLITLPTCASYVLAMDI